MIELRQPSHDTSELEKSILSSRFRVGPIVGEGSFGRVIQAHDSLLDRDVAIKLIAAPLGVGAVEQDGSLLLEARTASVAGSAAVTVFDVLTSDRGIAIVMEYVPAGSLVPAVRVGTPAVRARELGLAAVASMASVHRTGVLHLDLHPGNLLVRGDGSIAVSDFGLARLARTSGFSRGAHEMSWTAPELLGFRVVSAQADVYALGLILGWIERRSGVDFGGAVDRATAEDRRARPRDAIEMLDELDRGAPSPPTGARE